MIKTQETVCGCARVEREMHAHPTGTRTHPYTSDDGVCFQCVDLTQGHHSNALHAQRQKGEGQALQAA